MGSNGKLAPGEVEIELDDEVRILRPSVKAGKRVSMHFGGYTNALTKMRDLDVDAMAIVISLGLNSDDAERKVLTERVFKAGALKLSGPVSTYLLMLANGGKPLDEDEAAPTDKDEAGGVDSPNE